MPASEAQIRANRENAAKSCGPKTLGGKEASRANALKHGLTATVVTIAGEADVVDQRYRDFLAEFQPSGASGNLLALRAAVLSVRMERSVEHEGAATAFRVRSAQADFVPPEGVDETEAHLLRLEAGRLALFDTSKEADLARKYEAAAERGFLRCLKELRSLAREARAAEDAAIDQELASFSPAGLSDEEFDELSARMGLPPLPGPSRRPDRNDFGDQRGRIDVPFAIGKRT